MVDQRHEVANAPQRRVERNLVQVLDDDVVVVARETLAIVAVGQKWISVTCADAVNFDSVRSFALRRAHPGAAQKVNAMAPRNNPTEDFLEVKLGAAGLRVLEILPV
jgi:hypothetical protein